MYKRQEFAVRKKEKQAEIDQIRMRCIAEISRTELPEGLEQIIPILNKSGFLLASRGFQGGYRLAHTPDKYTVGDILRATEGSLSPVACLDNEQVLCQRADLCTTLSVWKGLKKVIDDRCV